MQVQEAGDPTFAATKILGCDTQIRKINFSTMLITSWIGEKGVLPAEVVLPNRMLAATASSPQAKDSLNLSGKSKVTDLTGTGYSRYNVPLTRSRFILIVALL